MRKTITLDDTVIQTENFQEESVDGLHKVTIDFKVTSEDYHDIATLLYKGTFDIKVPETGLAFKGTIQEYSTSITNLYEKGNVGEYHVSFVEVSN